MYKKEFEQISVLNHGFVKIVNVMGEDSTIAETARCSTQSEGKDDTGLVDYLFRHKHGSPFEFCEIVFHIKAPIFVFRHILRHRTASVNEKSLRYTEADFEYYVPCSDEIRLQSQNNRQMTSESVEDEEICNEFIKNSVESSNLCSNSYDNAIENGVCREQARTILPVSIYSEAYFKMDLRNLFNFFSLRLDEHAQLETRVFAQAMYDEVKKLFPISCASFEEHELYSITFSRTEIKVLRMLFSNASDNYSNPWYKQRLIDAGIRGGRLQECMYKLRLLNDRDENGKYLKRQVEIKKGVSK